MKRAFRASLYHSCSLRKKQNMPPFAISAALIKKPPFMPMEPLNKSHASPEDLFRDSLAFPDDEVLLTMLETALVLPFSRPLSLGYTWEREIDEANGLQSCEGYCLSSLYYMTPLIS